MPLAPASEPGRVALDILVVAHVANVLLDPRPGARRGRNGSAAVKYAGSCGDPRAYLEC